MFLINFRPSSHAAWNECVWSTTVSYIGNKIWNV